MHKEDTCIVKKRMGHYFTGAKIVHELNGETKQERRPRVELGRHIRASEIVCELERVGNRSGGKTVARVQ